MDHNQTELDDLTNDFVRAAGGRVLLSLAEVIATTGICERRLRTAIALGEIVGCRLARNGRIRIPARVLAKWALEQRRHSLPAPHGGGV